MVGNPIVVKVIESTIDKTIIDIKDNPKRGLNNLVDLANRFSSGPSQKNLVKILQSILKDPNNPYYNLIPSLINHVHPHTLKKFIINIAHNSWSYGRKIIKQYKKNYNYNIPWAIVFDLTQESESKLNSHKIIHIIEQGKKLGIYTYLFFTNNMDDFSTIQKQNPDCAFILYLPPTIFNKENIKRVKSYHNTFFSILYQPSLNTKAFKDATNLLHENHCLFGFHSYYTNDNINYILSDQWISEILTTTSPFIFLIESQNCIPTNASLIHNYVHNTKINQEHPAFLIDLYEDITQVASQSSNNASILKIAANGDISQNHLNSPPPHNITNTTLLEILSTQP